MRAVVLISLIWMLSACSENLDKGFISTVDRVDKIVGGTVVEAGSPQAASVVLITLHSPDGNSYICTGTFISEDLILTAAHCAFEDISTMGLLFGLAPFEGSPFTRLEINKTFFYHNDAGKNLGRNDIALIRFNGGLPDGAKIISLPKQESVIEGSVLDFEALGYGRINGVASEDDMDLVGSGTLRSVLLSSSDFSLSAAEFNVSQLRGQGVCFGDSGGPALLKASDGADTVIGVASGVYSAADVDETVEGFDSCTQQAVYMNVIPYLDWIKAHIPSAKIPSNKH